ncbi:hypothetical protein ACHAWT_009456 [Skeletonema menzelii]
MSSKEGDNEVTMGTEKDNEYDSDASISDDGSTNGIVLSLRDPTYLCVMHQYFKKLGSRTNPNNPDFTEAMATKEVFDIFKNKHGKFLKLKNARSFEGGFIEVDDEDAMDKIQHDMTRRMESAKRWLDSKQSNSPVKKEKSSSTKKSPSTSPNQTVSARKQTNSSIVLSLTDPTYREVMHKYFRKMGPKTKSTDESKSIAMQALKEFKRMSGKFVKIENWRDPNSDYVAVNDDEAVKRIKIDFTRRNDSMKQWLLDSKSKSSVPKSKKSPSKQDSVTKGGSDDDDSDSDSDSFKPSPRTLRKKEIPNYANSGAEIVSKTALQVEAERTAKQSLSAKDKLSAEESSDDESDSDSDSSVPSPRALRKKEIPNYANSGEKIVSKTALQVEAERTAKQTLSAKGKSPAMKQKLGTYIFESSNRTFYDLSSRVTKLRENDVIISLRDAKYRDALVSYFHRLGTEQDRDKNQEAADEVFEMFKKEGGRFFKPNGRGKDADCDQVEDSFASQNIYLDIRRRTDSTWWWEEEVDVTPSTKKSSSVKMEVTKKAKPTRHVLVSLSDPNYRAVLEVQFKKLGVKTGPDRREIAAAEEVFNRFKREGTAFCRLENFRDASSDPIEMDDDEAFKKIRTDIQRRMESAKRWLKGGVNSKSYADTNKSSPKKAAHVHKSAKKSRPENSKKRELPIEMHRSSPSKKRVKTGASLSRSEISRHSEGFRKSDRVATESSRRGSKRLASSMNTDAANASRVRSASLNRSHRVSVNAAKVTICFGDHVINTDADPSLVQPSQSHILESLPGRFDPNVRPSVPAYNKQIYIPGNEVYARWLNENDPSSYGTWYPGYVYSSKLAPTNVPGGDMPKLLYHVKFHDGAEGMDLHTGDMMMREQYEAWLHDLEEYFALPQLGDAFKTRIPKGSRVYAQWIDPSDPEAHGSWLQGTVRDVIDSRRYHVRFDNGDEDDDMSADHVLLDGVYVQLLGEKMKNGSGQVVNRQSAVASSVNGSSGHLQQRLGDSSSRATAPSNSTRVQKPTTLKFTCEIATEDLDLSSNDGILEELRCDEVLATVKHIARSKTQGIHYGIYVTAKPWNHTPELEIDAPIEIGKPSENEVEREDVSEEELRCEETLV